MKNIEKYKNELLNVPDLSLACRVSNLTGQSCRGRLCSDCNKEALIWLLSEYKAPVLDEIEKKYLSAVINPFRKNVSFISKMKKGYQQDICFIAIALKTNERIGLPYFNIKSGMYKGMQAFRKYTLEELGL